MKKISAILITVCILFSLSASVCASELPFTDVKKDDWFYNDVKTAYESGIINGKSANEYKPSDNMTYAEAIKLAACMNMLAAEGEINFESGDPWYKPYVDYCKEKKIISKEYEYNRNATRSGYMEIFANCLPDSLLKEINSIEDGSIPDVPDSASYAPSVYKLYRAGILTGVDDEHNCNPTANIRRSEVAAILTRMNDKETRQKFSIGNAGKSTAAKELEFTVQPKDTEIAVGSTATLSVEVRGGKEPYTYQWKGDDSGMGMYSALTEGEMVSGEATKELKLSFLKKGSIDVVCAVMDSDGKTITSNKATVTANVAALKITEQPKDTEAEIGERSTMYILASGGNGSYTYKWEYDLDGTWIEIKSSTEGYIPSANSLNFTPKKAGTVKIRCIVTDEDNTEIISDTASFTTKEAEVSEPLSITSQPESVTLPGTTGEVKFTVEAKGGTANNKYQWQYCVYNHPNDWKDVPVNDFVKTSGVDTPSLSITVTDDNRATLVINNFRCVITDENGESITSDTVSFKVTK